MITDKFKKILEELINKKVDSNQKIKELEKEIKLLKEFKDNDSYCLISSYGGKSFIYPFDIASKLLRIIDKTQNTSSAIEWIESIFSNEKSIVYCRVAIWGIDLEETLIINDNISLIPVKDLPNSENKNDLLNYRDHKYRRNIGSLGFSTPNTVLNYTVTFDKVLFPINSEKDIEEVSKKLLDIKNHLNDLVLCLTLIGPSSPFELFSWVESSVIENIDRGTCKTFPNNEVLPTILKEVKIDNTNIAQLKELFDKFISRKENAIREKLKIAINRLNLACRRINIGDKAIELSIALEVLLIDGHGEKKYQLSLRVAKYLGTTIEEKIQIRKTIEELYDIRSNFVHEGRVGKKYKSKGNDIINNSMEYCSKIIRNIILNTEFPDWKKIEIQ